METPANGVLTPMLRSHEGHVQKANDQVQGGDSDCRPARVSSRTEVLRPGPNYL